MISVSDSGGQMVYLTYSNHWLLMRCNQLLNTDFTLNRI